MPVGNSRMGESHVIDASIVLAALLGEADHAAATEVLEQGGVMSAVNVAEVVARMLRTGIGPGPAEAAVESFDILVLPVDRRAAHRIAHLEARTRAWGLSMADRACIDAGRVTGLPIVTADRAWANLDPVELGVEIRVIR